jgi:hypothetical protein
MNKPLNFILTGINTYRQWAEWEFREILRFVRYLCGTYETTRPVTVAARSKVCTLFARFDAGIVGSNPTQGMDVWCVYAFILFVFSCV